jgi:hypothetical protein
MILFLIQKAKNDDDITFLTLPMYNTIYNEDSDDNHRKILCDERIN